MREGRGFFSHGLRQCPEVVLHHHCAKQHINPPSRFPDWLLEGGGWGLWTAAAKELHELLRQTCRNLLSFSLHRLRQQGLGAEHPCWLCVAPDTVR